MHSLLYASPLNGLGYGTVGTQVLRQLDKDINVTCFPIGNVQVTDQQDADIIKKTHYSNITEPKYTGNPYILKIWHQNSLFDRPGKGKYFGWPIFELDRFNELELYSLQQPDELIVCSQWAKQVILKDLPDTIVHVVPLGVDSSIFKPTDLSIHINASVLENDTYTFYTIGKLSKNKGHDILASAFNKAFEQSDKVQLKLLTNNPFFNADERDYWEGLFTKSKLANKVKLEPRLPTSQDVASFINECDCGIFCSRAEGWNLGLLESMACSKPVIATDYSGHTEYCTSDNCLLINVSQNNLEDAHDNKWFHGQGKWAILGLEQEEELVEYMRFCYKNRVRENPTGLETANHYTWDNTGKELKKVLWSP